MGQWAVIIPAERWAQERLFHHESLTVTVADATASGAAPGDDVLLLAGEHVVAVGRMAPAADEAWEIAYVRRLFDAPIPADQLKLGGTVTAIERDAFDRVMGQAGAAGDRRTWLVSVALPIEATSPAEAVRQFWSHVSELGPAEVPADVWPSGEELAMQAFVLGAEANQDPEEDDED